MFGSASRNISQTADKVRLFLIFCGVFLLGYYTLTAYIDRGWSAMPIILIADFVFLVGVALTFTKYKDSANLFYLIPAQAFMSYQIAIAGGVFSPGYFWLSAIPVLWALLYSVRGLVFGYLSVLATYGYLWQARSYEVFETAFPTEEAFNRARIENFVLFTTFLSAFILAYTIVLRKSQEKIEEKQKDVENLLRILVHDVSNPLMVIQGCVDKMNRLESKESQAIAKMMGRSTSRLYDIVNDVRNLYSLKDGKTEVKLEKGDLVQCIQDSLQSLSEKVLEKEIKVELKNVNDPIFTELNATMMTNQVLTNILSNAIKFSPPNGKITISACVQEKQVLIEIQDEGIGIPDELLNRLFLTDQPTSRVGTQGEKGTGYGLPIAKHVMLLHHGDIYIASPPPAGDQGTLIQLRFPLLLVSEEQSRTIA